MKLKLLLTSTSFSDTPGKHQDLLNEQGFEIDYLRGPIGEEKLLTVIDKYDAVICGDDEYTAKVLEKGKSGKLKFISKYGVGLDKIDLVKAKELGISVTNCPGVNQISVSEHVFALLLTFTKNIHTEYNITQAGGWERLTSTEIYGKTIGIVGLGAIGKEVAKRAIAFGLQVIVYDKLVDQKFITDYSFEVANTFEDLAKKSDIITLHLPHTPSTENIIKEAIVKNCLKKGVIIINTARGKLVNLAALQNGLKSGIIAGYLADVLDIEPMPVNYPMKDWKNVIITPHIGSRSFESVERQGLYAVKNLIDIAQANS